MSKFTKKKYHLKNNNKTGGAKAGSSARAQAKTASNLMPVNQATVEKLFFDVKELRAEIDVLQGKLLTKQKHTQEEAEAAHIPDGQELIDPPLSKIFRPILVKDGEGETVHYILLPTEPDPSHTPVDVYDIKKSSNLVCTRIDGDGVCNTLFDADATDNVVMINLIRGKPLNQQPTLPYALRTHDNDIKLQHTLIYNKIGQAVLAEWG
jgi:hypothetical protein